MSEKIDEICVYCGTKNADTSDHVPPKNLFPSPKPPDLKTVPACRSCNEGFKKDEDWFLGLMSFSDAGISPVGAHIWKQRFNRMYQKDTGLRQIIARRISLQTVQAVDGSMTPISATKGAQGQSKLATSIAVTVLCCIFAIFMKGKDVTFEQGSSYNAFTLAPVEVRVP